MPWAYPLSAHGLGSVRSNITKVRHANFYPFRIHHIGKNEYNHRVKDSIISWLCNDVDSNCLGLLGGHFYFQLLRQYLALHRSISFYNQQREQERRKQQRLKTWAWPHLTWGTYLVRKKVKGLKGKLKKKKRCVVSCDIVLFCHLNQVGLRSLIFILCLK